MSKLTSVIVLALTSVSAFADQGNSFGVSEPETAAIFAVAAVVGLAARYLKK